MPRKSSKTASITTAMKNTTVPPKAVEAIKPVIASIPASAIAAEKAAAAKATETKIENKPAVVTAKSETAPVVVAKSETTPVVIAKTECCQATAGAASSKTCADHSATVTAAISALHSDDADTARDAASTLGLLGDRSAVEPLIEALSNNCGFFHSVVRAAAAESLGNLGDTRATESLLIALTDPIAEVSSESIRALATIGDAQAVEALGDVVRNRAGFFLPLARHAAVLGLAKLGGESAIDTLRFVAGDEFEDATIRNAAEAGLTKSTTASTK